MKYKYKPHSQLEDFGEKIYKLLVDNFPQTFYVGGMVRDILLNKKVKDIDIATSAKPEEAKRILLSHKINFFNEFEKFGIITANNGNLKIEIATFRKESYGKSRYPKVEFVFDAKTDSQRRDFTINALYLRANTGQVLDFYKGLDDLKARQLRFIGKPVKRITEDPLRIVRALRFVLELNLKIQSQTKSDMQKYFYLVKTLTASKVQSEINKIKNIRNKKIIILALNEPKSLDNLLKTR